MKQLNMIDDLGWLLDEMWKPARVKVFRNHGEMSNEEFDLAQARSYGYKSVEDMNRHNYNKFKLKAIKYGDSVIRKDSV